MLFFVSDYWLRICENCFKIICCWWIYFEIDVLFEYKLNGIFNIVLFFFNFGGGKLDCFFYENIIVMFSFFCFCVMYLDLVMLIRLMDLF